MKNIHEILAAHGLAVPEDKKAEWPPTTGAEAAVYERLGKDLEDFSADLSAKVDKKKNIMGETSVNISS